MVLVYHKADLLQPIPPQLILPEVIDQAKWWSKNIFIQTRKGNMCLWPRVTRARVLA